LNDKWVIEEIKVEINSKENIQSADTKQHNVA
jgi:hypothetical protein